MTTQTLHPSVNRFLRLPEVMTFTGLKRSAIYDAIDHGTFPKPVKLSARAVGWTENDLATWAAQRLAEREAA